MDQTNSSKIPGCLEGMIHWNVINTKGVIIGHEELEASYSFLNHSFHLVLSVLVPFSDGSMQGIIRVHFSISACSPGLVTWLKSFSLVCEGEINEGCCTAWNSSSWPVVKIISRLCPHKRKFHVGVRVDSARDDKPISTVDNLCIFMGNIFPYTRNLSILD